MAFRSIRSRRRKKRTSTDFDLQLTSLMDILVIIVVFLLKSYATSINNFATVPGLKMPISVSEDMPLDSLQVIITPDGLTFENLRIVDFLKTAESTGTDDVQYQFKKTDLADDGMLVVPLSDALNKAREKAEVLRSKSQARDADGKPLPFEGILAIQADKRVNYDTVRKIMYTAATSGFKIFRFLAMKKDT